MTTITHQDLIHIVTGAVGMAKQDNIISDGEKDFLTRLMNKAEVKPEEIQTEKVDFKAIAGQLSSKRAKQVFLLALAAVAKSDIEIAEEENQFFLEMAKILEIGVMEIKMHSKILLEKMVLDHLSD